MAERVLQEGLWAPYELEALDLSIRTDLIAHLIRTSIFVFYKYDGTHFDYEVLHTAGSASRALAVTIQHRPDTSLGALVAPC